MLTRRELIKKSGALIGVGMLGAIIPRHVAQAQEAEIAHPLSAKAFMDNVMQPFADGMMEGIEATTTEVHYVVHESPKTWGVPFPDKMSVAEEFEILRMIKG